MITQRKRKKKFFCFFLSFGCATQHVASYFSDQELNSCPPHWKFEVSTTGLPGKSLKMIFFFFFSLVWFYLTNVMVLHREVDGWHLYSCFMSAVLNCFSFVRLFATPWL